VTGEESVDAGPHLRYQTIRKRTVDLRVEPNLDDYESARAAFSWERARSELTELPGGGLNIAYECVDRHASGDRRDHLAIRWLGRHGDVRDLTYGDLNELTNRFANALTKLDVSRGDRVFVLTGRIPELYTSVLGTLKAGAVACTLFSAFGPEPIRQRLEIGGGRVLVTTEALYRRKVAAIRDDLPEVEHVVLISPRGRATNLPGTLDFHELLDAASPEYEIQPTDPEDMALLHFTSGTTGTPKAAVHVHEAVVAHHATGKLALDLHPDDVYWCTADPGWVTGTSYGIVSPLAHGVTSIVDEGEFDAERWYRILDEHAVSVWYTAPTAVRMMMKMGASVAREYRVPNLRFIASVGEALNPEAVQWGVDAFGLPIHDNWWQTETGGIMIANYPAMDIRPGSMGRPLPGIDAAVVRRDEHGTVVVHGDEAEVVHDPLAEGELALRPGWPSMFRGYLHEEDRYHKCFAGGWYLTGDLVMRDADGYFWFVGRADDVIKSAGHLIGPFEVESTLMEHPAVAEAGVIGKPDPVMGELVKAFVSLRSGYEPSEELRLELVGFARKRLGAAVAPRELAFADNLPKTRSGKIMRRLLRARELGLPEGDLSTLEAD
jgi:acetyl-CoA synthetase